MNIQTAIGKAHEGGCTDVKCDTYETRESGHGRDEYRCYTVLHTSDGIRNAADWAKLKTIGFCYSERSS